MPPSSLPTLSPQENLGLRLYCLGKPLSEASREVQVSESRLRRAVASKAGQAEILRIRSTVDEEFQNLQTKVNETLRLALDSADIETALAGANLWIRASKAKGPSTQTTVEDVLIALFNQAEKRRRQEVQDPGPPGPPGPPSSLNLLLEAS